MLEGPRDKAIGGVPDAVDVGIHEIGDLLPGNATEIGGMEVGAGEVGTVQTDAGQVGSGEVAVAEIGMGEDGVFKIGVAQIREVQVGPGEIGEVKIAVAKVGGAKRGAHEIGVGETHSLEKCGRDVDAREGDVVGVEFLESFDAAAAAALALGGVDDLPCLVMALLDTVAGLNEPEDDADQDGETAEVFEDFEEAPVAEEPCKPFPCPVDGYEGDKPAVAGAGSALGPGNGTVAGMAEDHRF